MTTTRSRWFAMASPALALALILGTPGTRADAEEPTFRKHIINAESIFEGAGAFDVDGDGDIDIVSGGFWYEAPSWTRHKVRDVERAGTYMNCFSTIPMDVNADGHMDFISVSYFGNNIGWVENPGETGTEWTYHEIDLPGPSEAAVAVDLTGDGKLEILPNPLNTIVFYSLEETGSNPVFRAYRLGDEGAGHGVGTGDVNGNGRTDLLTPKGWYEAPEDPTTESWTFHPAWDLGAAGIQILARDVDGDGASDIIYGMGHARGLFWKKGKKDADGALSWSNPILIDDEVTSVHTLLWVDLNGDGKDDELLTGKRVYAHEREEGDVEASIIAYYRFDSDKDGWDRFVIEKSEPAINAPDDPSKRDAQKDFPRGTAGTGLEIAVVDIDGDGDLDLICPGKSGLYLFENLSKNP